MISIRGGLKAAAEVDAVKESVEDLDDEVDESTRSALGAYAAFKRLTRQMREFAASEVVATATIRQQNGAMRALLITTLALGVMAMPLVVSTLGAATLASVVMLGAIVGLGAGIGLMAAGAVLRFKETSDAAGSAAADLKATAGTLKDTFGAATAKGADQLFLGIARGLRTANPLISEFTNEFTAIGAAGGDAFATFADRFVAAGPEIGALLRQIPQAIGPLGDLAATAMDLFLRLANVGMPLLIDGVQWLDDVTGKWVDSLTDARVDGALSTIHTAFDGISRFVTAIADTLGPELLPAAADLATTLDHVAGPLGTIIGAILAGFVQLGHGALPGVQTAIEQIAPALQAIVDSGTLRTLGQAIGATFGTAATVIGTVATELQRVGLLRPVILGVVAAFTAWKVATVALNLVMRANPILLVVSAIAALAVGVVYAYRRFAWFRNAVDTVWSSLKTGFNWVKDHWPLVLSILTGPIGAATIFIVRHFDQIVSFITGLPGKIGGAAKGVGEAIASGVKSGVVAAVNWVIDRLNDLIGAYNSISGIAKAVGVDLTIGKIGHVGGSGGGDGLLGSVLGTVGKIGKGVKRAPGAAGGGFLERAGLVWTGEHGKELVNLPAGAGVLDHNSSMALARTRPLNTVSAPDFGTSLDGSLAELPTLFAEIRVDLDGREVGRGLDRVRLNDRARKGG
ncbi:minor tail protein [Patulibacter medicamentivorans]|uniref:Minor tail protein n=1 Tax=Patulibacter medicamentivorans TaxID=1097667 RepID=H0EA86_9ACTN|nr:hypothetical protein [Patulibacter medicamentivorans]EHN09426.1 minor tail protein [Patulibacter medicamentivorans]